MTRIALIEINLGNVSTPQELHQLLMESLDFPHWYGRNRDAFWDAITGLVEMPETLRLLGWKKFSNTFPKDAMLMQKFLDKRKTFYSNETLNIEYDHPQTGTL